MCQHWQHLYRQFRIDFYLAVFKLAKVAEADAVGGRQDVAGVDESPTANLNFPDKELMNSYKRIGINNGALQQKDFKARIIASGKLLCL